MKRTLSLLLIFLFCLTFLPLRQAQAETTVSKANVQVTAPAAGAYPDYSPTFSSAGFTSTGTHDDMKNGIYWKDETIDYYLYPGADYFDPGHVYTIFITLTCKSGYVFSDSCAFTINSKTAKKQEVSSDHRSATIYYTFSALPQAKPVITAQPKNVTAATGTTAKFTVVANNAESYRWQWSKDGGSTWKDCTSATAGYNTATLKVSATGRNRYKYRCKVTNSAGTVTSSVATLTAGSKPDITAQPKSVTVYVGKTAKFTVTATSADKYQWQWSKDGGSTWKDSTSATTGYNKATLQVSATADRSGYKYRCKVTNSFGTVTSSVVTLTVSKKPLITTQPKSVTASSGSTAKFTVGATGATKYLWQWSKDGGSTWKDCTSATTGYNTATLQVSTTGRNGYKYRCKVSNSSGTTTSSVATLTVH